MKLKAREMEALFGLSPNGLKLYEKQGIMAPEREENSRYRRYGKEEMQMMGFASKLRGFGFGLSEIADMLRLNTEEFGRERLVTRGEEIDREIERLQSVRRAMRVDLRAIDEAKALMGAMKSIVRPSMFFLETRRGDTWMDESRIDLLTEWEKRYSPHLSPAAFFDESGDCVSGVAMHAAVADQLGLQMRRGVVFLPPRESIMLGVEVSDESELLPFLRHRPAETEPRAFVRYYAVRKIGDRLIKTGLMWLPLMGETGGEMA